MIDNVHFTATGRAYHPQGGNPKGAIDVTLPRVTRSDAARSLN